MSCGAGCRRGSDPELLWLWCRLAAVALIRPLAWERPYATGVALKTKKANLKSQFPLLLGNVNLGQDNKGRKTLAHYVHTRTSPCSPGPGRPRPCAFLNLVSKLPFSSSSSSFWDHMEVPQRGAESELQPPDYTTATATLDPSRISHPYCSFWQHRILNPPSTARDQT